MRACISEQKYALWHNLAFYQHMTRLTDVRVTGWRDAPEKGEPRYAAASRYTEYVLMARIGTQAFSAAHRYSNFRKLHVQLGCLQTTALDFPECFPVPRALFHSDALKASRAKALTQYLELAVAAGGSSPPLALCHFLGISESVLRVTAEPRPSLYEDPLIVPASSGVLPRIILEMVSTNRVIRCLRRKPDRAVQALSHRWEERDAVGATHEWSVHVPGEEPFTCRLSDAEAGNLQGYLRDGPVWCGYACVRPHDAADRAAQASVAGLVQLVATKLVVGTALGRCMPPADYLRRAWTLGRHFGAVSFPWGNLDNLDKEELPRLVAFAADACARLPGLEPLAPKLFEEYERATDEWRVRALEQAADRAGKQTAAARQISKAATLLELGNLALTQRELAKTVLRVRELVPCDHAVDPVGWQRRLFEVECADPRDRLCGVWGAPMAQRGIELDHADPAGAWALVAQTFPGANYAFHTLAPIPTPASTASAASSTAAAAASAATGAGASDGGGSPPPTPAPPPAPAGPADGFAGFTSVAGLIERLVARGSGGGGDGTARPLAEWSERFSSASSAASAAPLPPPPTERVKGSMVVRAGRTAEPVTVVASDAFVALSWTREAPRTGLEGPSSGPFQAVYSRRLFEGGFHHQQVVPALEGFTERAAAMGAPWVVRSGGHGHCGGSHGGGGDDALERTLFTAIRDACADADGDASSLLEGELRLDTSLDHLDASSDEAEPPTTTLQRSPIPPPSRWSVSADLVGLWAAGGPTPAFAEQPYPVGTGGGPYSHDLRSNEGMVTPTKRALIPREYSRGSQRSSGLGL